MIRPVALALSLCALATMPAIAQEAGPAAEPPTELKALAESCSAHKFETFVIREGGRRGSKVTICGKEGQTKADWLVTLRDSVAKTQANAELAPEIRDQIVAALKAEIARLESATSTSAPVTIAVSTEPVRMPEAPPQYSVVPPLPAPKPRAASTAASAAVPPVIRPRLTIRCGLPREKFADCDSLRQDTQLLIRADERLAGGTSIRFLRGGDERAEFDLGPLNEGDVLREKLPKRVCSGVLRGKVQIQVLSKGRVAETLGPYALYCGS